MKSKTYLEKIITIPENVEIEKRGSILFFIGPLGSTQLCLEKIDPTGKAFFHLNSSHGLLKITTRSKSFFGGISRIIQNKIIGVTRGFLVPLGLVGVGYRATREGDNLKIRAGFSHEIQYKIPDSIQVFSLQPSLFCLYGIEKNQVYQIGYKIRQKRPPSTYKGKGIRLVNEKVVVKQGKRK